MPGKPKIHLLHDVGFRVKGDPIQCQWHSICPTLQTAQINPETTTWDRRKVTCGNCKRRILGLNCVKAQTWSNYVESLSEADALRGRPKEAERGR